MKLVYAQLVRSHVTALNPLHSLNLAKTVLMFACTRWALGLSMYVMHDVNIKAVLASVHLYTASGPFSYSGIVI